MLSDKIIIGEVVKHWYINVIDPPLVKSLVILFVLIGERFRIDEIRKT